MKIRKTLTACLMLCCSIAYGHIYYAAPKGKGDGTIDKPADLTQALKTMAAGDTLYLKGGQYDLTNTLSAFKSGPSVENMTLVCANPGDTVILDWRKQTYGRRAIKIDPEVKYVHLKDLTIRYSGKTGVLCFGSYCILENLDVYGNCDSGVQLKSEGGHNLILNVDSHHNFDYRLGGTDKADFGGNADGFADKQVTGPGNTYIGCRAWENSDDGWDFYQRITTDSVASVIEDCICYANGPKEYDMTNHPRYKTDYAWFMMFEDGGCDILDDDSITYHAMKLDHYMNFGNGNGFKLGGKNTVHDVILRHCLSAGNTVKGFDQNDNFGSMTLTNCIGLGNGRNYGFMRRNGGKLYISQSMSLQTKNNDKFLCPDVVQEGNNWNKGSIKGAMDFIEINTTEITGPRQPDGSLNRIPLLYFRY